jgi:hypothetical protein
MSRRVFIHVGAPKTGTTYLQDRLRVNRNELAKNGVHYPLGPLGVHAAQFRAALDLIDYDWGGVRALAEGQWDALVKRVRRLDGTVIISHEILAAAAPDKIARAMADLADSEIHVVYSARDLARQIPAEWQESIKQNRKWPYRVFLEQVRTKPQLRSDMWFWKVQGLPDVLGRWSAGLPPERVHLVTVPQSGAPRDLLWQRFCEVFGIDPAWAPKDSQRGNESMGVAEATVVRRLNRRLAKAGLPIEDHRALVKELLVHQNLAKRGSAARVTLPPDMYAWADEVTDTWIEWVEGSGIDVAGNLADLKPQAPQDGRRWRDPDHPSRKRMLDAALEALTVMTLEAADRPHPDDQLSGKVKKAARRIRGDDD